MRSSIKNMGNALYLEEGLLGLVANSKGYGDIRLLVGCLGYHMTHTSKLQSRRKRHVDFNIFDLDRGPNGRP